MKRHEAVALVLGADQEGSGERGAMGGLTVRGWMSIFLLPMDDVVCGRVERREREEWLREEREKERRREG